MCKTRSSMFSGYNNYYSIQSQPQVVSRWGFRAFLLYNLITSKACKDVILLRDLKLSIIHIVGS